MKSPKIIIPPAIVDTLGCVYRLWYNGKYVIVMAKSIYRSIDSINQDIVRAFKNGSVEGNLYEKFYLHILEYPKQNFYIDLFFESENPYHLLQVCQIKMDSAKLDHNCLNSKFTPYVNKDIQKPVKDRKSTWWINRGVYLNFKTWLNKRNNSITLKTNKK